MSIIFINNPNHVFRNIRRPLNSTNNFRCVLPPAVITVLKFWKGSSVQRCYLADEPTLLAFGVRHQKEHGPLIDDLHISVRVTLGPYSNYTPTKFVMFMQQ